MHDGFLDTAYSCGDDRQSRRRRFEHYPRKSLPARRQQQQIEAAHGSRNIAPPAGQPHLVLQTFFMDEGFKTRPHGSVPDEDKPGAREPDADPLGHRDHVFGRLLRLEAGHGPNQKLARADAKFLPKALPIRRRERLPKRVRVDSGPDDRHIRREQSPCPSFAGIDFGDCHPVGGDPPGDPFNQNQEALDEAGLSRRDPKAMHRV